MLDRKKSNDMVAVMVKGFWEKLHKPFFVLAPMADVTDAAYRRIIARYGKPDVMYTEFVSADGLVRAPEEGKKKLLKDLSFTEAERPIVAQFFTSNPEYMERAAALAAKMGFDGVDINMGCPDRSVERQGSGAALIKNPRLAREIIQSAKRGAPNLPVSVKTRIGYNKDELETWIPELLKEEPTALIIHARTRKEMSLVPARWEAVGRAVKLRDALGSPTLIVGNGDALDIQDGRKKAEESGADGVMLGRAIFGNPWMFAEYTPATEEKLSVLVEHTRLYEELLGGIKSFAIMKKHYKAYVNGFDGAKELRMKLMDAADAEEVSNIVEEWLAGVALPLQKA